MMLDLTTCVDIIYDSISCPPGSVALSPRDEVSCLQLILCKAKCLTFPPFSRNVSTSFAQTTWFWTAANVWWKSFPIAGHFSLTTWRMPGRSFWFPRRERMCWQSPGMVPDLLSQNILLPMALMPTLLSQQWSHKLALVQRNGFPRNQNWGSFLFSWLLSSTALPGFSPALWTSQRLTNSSAWSSLPAYHPQHWASISSKDSWQQKSILPRTLSASGSSVAYECKDDEGIFEVDPATVAATAQTGIPPQRWAV